MARRFTATYLPYTFEELIKPVLLYNEAYKDLEKQLDDLDALSALLNKLDPNLDLIAYNKNLAQQNRLLNISDEMSSKGLNPSLRAAITQMRRFQRSDLDPYITAYKEREDLIKELRAKGSDYIFDKDYSKTSLDDMLTGTNTYNAYNLAEAEKQGMASAKAISERIYNDPKLSKELKDQYFKMSLGILTAGQTAELILNSNTDLQDAFNNWYSSTFGLNPVYGLEDLDRARERYLNGIMDGLVYNESYQANRGYESPAEKRAAYNLAWEREWKLSKELGLPDSDGNRRLDLGNGVVKVTPKADNILGIGTSYWTDDKGNKLSLDDVSKKLGKGTLVGEDASGNKIYNNGKAIIKENSKGEIVSITPLSKSNLDIERDYGSGNIKKVDDLNNFLFLSFDSNYRNPGNINQPGSTLQHRSSLANAIAHGYHQVPTDLIPPSARELILSLIKNKYKKFKGDWSDLIVLEEGPHHTETKNQPGFLESGDNHYIVTLKPDIYEQFYGESPLRGMAESEFTSSTTPVLKTAAELEAELLENIGE